MAASAFVSLPAFPTLRQRAPLAQKCQRRRTVAPARLVRLCSDPDSEPGTVAAPPCTYCHDEKIVVCPVCEGDGYLGQTIPCYYCHGAKNIECPLCIDDIYRTSWQPSPKAVFEEEEDEESGDNTEGAAVAQKDTN